LVVRVAPVLVVVFALLTIADGLSIYRCGWFWTSIGALFCAAGWATGRGEVLLLRRNVAAFILLVGFSAGVTPFVAPYLLPYLST
jgi:hypothetical protein